MEFASKVVSEALLRVRGERCVQFSMKLKQIQSIALDQHIHSLGSGRPSKIANKPVGAKVSKLIERMDIFGVDLLESGPV